MSSSLRFRCIVSLALGLVACSKRSAEYCAGHPDDTTNCPAPDAAGCTGNADCTTATAAVCDIPSSTCVECTTTDDDACAGTTPVCSTAHACTACTSHDQCTTSDVCLPTGACAVADDVAYVSAAGTGTACTKSAPCPLLADALATHKDVIKIAADGAKNDTAPVTIDGVTVTILAAPGASLDRDGDGPILEVRNTSNVTIYDLHITGAASATGHGVQLSVGAPTVSLHRVTVDANAGAGISASGGSLDVTQSTISQNTGAGISASGGSLSVAQSTISQNTGGGIYVGSAGTFDITNCFIYRNGNQDSGTIGGIAIDGSVVANNRIAFNTIVDNRVTTNALKSGGIVCSIIGFAAPNNIIARNQSGSSTTASNAQTLGDCTYPTSMVQADLAGLALESSEMAPYSYKLTTGSAAVDAATTPSTIDVDFDGDARPQGAAKDIGADELP